MLWVMRIPYAASVGGAALAVVGVLLVFVFPSEPLVMDIPLPGPAVDRNLLITTERAIGIALVWAATLLGSRVLGRWCAKRFRIPAMGLILSLSAVVAIVGFYLVFVLDATPTFTIGSFSFDSDGVSGRRMPFALFLTTGRVVGFALLWIASFIVVGSVGQRRREIGK